MAELKNYVTSILAALLAAALLSLTACSGTLNADHFEVDPDQFNVNDDSLDLVDDDRFNVNDDSLDLVDDDRFNVDEDQLDLETDVD
jgi:hypothetical protein